MWSAGVGSTLLTLWSPALGRAEADSADETRFILPPLSSSQFVSLSPAEPTPPSESGGVSLQPSPLS